MNKSSEIVIEAWGDYADFNQPNLRSERISSITPSHSAAVGLLRGINGHRAIRWTVHELTLLSEPVYHPMLLNELKFNSTRTDVPIIVDRDTKTQRMTVFLRNYRCRIKASFTLSSQAEPNDNIPKFEEMTRSRLRMGVERRHIYFGIKECKAHVMAAEGPANPVDITSDFGLVFYDVDWEDPEQPYYFAPLSMVHGVVRYPSWDTVRGLGIKRLIRRTA